MDMFSKLTTLFQQALETREPSVNLLDSFVEHWKGITNYYIVTTDESRPVKQTDIPWRLKQMLDIVVYEEAEQGVEETGPCLEYLLQHKLLETLCTLGKAQYPPGMSQQVFLFFSQLLAQIKKPVLHLINVYRPVQKLIRLCGHPGSQTEKEEAQFLLVVCSRLKQDPYVVHYILEINKEKLPKRSMSASQDVYKEGKDETDALPSNQSDSSSSYSSSISSQSSSPASASSQYDCLSSSLDNTSLIHVLVKLSKSQTSRVSLKAYESLLLLATLQTDGTGESLADCTPLCHLLAERLAELYTLLPSTLDPADTLNWPHTHWSFQFSPVSQEETLVFPGSDHMHSFFAWLDFLDHLMKESSKVLAVKLAKAIHQQWLVAVVQSELLQLSEARLLISTALLCCVVRHIQSHALLDELVSFLLGNHTHGGELRLDTDSHALRYHLIEHCDHISDEISVTSLRLFEELLQKPHRVILANLVLRNLEHRCYATLSPGGLEERYTAETEQNEDLEEDPFFTDSMYSDSEFLCSDHLLLPSPSSSSSSSGDHPHSGHTQAADVVNSFLCLVPQEAKSSHLVQGAAYDTYVHDAHKLFKECSILCGEWNWPENVSPPDGCAPALDFYEGHFLKVLLDRIGRILEQPYELNLQLTSVLSRLAAFPHPLLHEYLLDPYICLAPGARSLFSVLIRVIGELMQRLQLIPNATHKLVNARQQLMGLDNDNGVDNVTLMRGVIVLEEFCKELAAIAFVKLPLKEH